MKPFIVTSNVTLVIGEQRLQLETGDEVFERDLPPGKWKSLVNTQTLVPQAVYEQMFAPAVRGVEPPPSSPSAEQEEDAGEDEEGEEIPEWQKTPVASLGLRPEAVVAYQGAGLTTVRDLLVYGATKGSLATLRGIGESTEKTTMAAIERLMPKPVGDQTTN